MGQVARREASDPWAKVQCEFFLDQVQPIEGFDLKLTSQRSLGCCLGKDSSGLQVRDDAGPNLGGDSKDGEESPGVTGGKNSGTWRKAIEWALPSWAKEGDLEQ